jgi:hypothetical protein
VGWIAKVFDYGNPNDTFFLEEETLVSSMQTRNTTRLKKT